MFDSKQEISFDKINQIAYENESKIAENLLDYLKPEYISRINNIEDRALEIVESVRKSIKSDSPIEDLLQEYELNTKEGTVLLCLAEALLRIPDNKTIDRLLEDKFTSADWKKHTGIDKGILLPVFIYILSKEIS